jgi:hypothetical protein
MAVVGRGTARPRIPAGAAALEHFLTLHGAAFRAAADDIRFVNACLFGAHEGRRVQR